MPALELPDAAHTVSCSTRHRAALIAALMAALVVAFPATGVSASAQDFSPRPRVQAEFRGDVAVARTSSAMAMAGANVPLGLYVRLGLAGGGGVWWRDGKTGAAADADLTVRYLLDPFGESARGLYVGGGLTMRADAERRAGLLLLLGGEGRVHRGYRLALEAGLGEGVRVAMVLRRARKFGR